ncbi:MAG: OmpA family protein [Rhodospirillales bacterium]|jgi:chemotaxis protein MotB|nr:OmpA family protein [Rhodospirillales bacterium]MBT4891396.1 OmpA family protein [Gammaproteobacteria bacterium]MBT4040513.1 OmpA family protein [Rhodospirillales bacterium]MBT4626468.1 OmpA family protein [Rhodospirillales bacterium]MBT5350849.1 OmpA family protein [Rhodospirillales bacterium]
MIDNTSLGNDEKVADIASEQLAPLIKAARRRRKAGRPVPQPQGPGDEWMITYMDTVTLLVTLFVILLSFANFDEAKYRAFTNALSITDYGVGVLSSSPRPIESEFSQDDIIMKTISDTAEIMADEFRTSIEASGLADQVSLNSVPAGVELEINESVLFSIGSAELTQLGRSVIENLAGILDKPGIMASVEGHTDNVPIQTEKYGSNWELSGARASAVVRYLIGAGVDPDVLRIVGYADTKPKWNNETADGRKNNRRVNVIVSFNEAKDPG